MGGFQHSRREREDSKKDKVSPERGNIAAKKTGFFPRREVRYRGNVTFLQPLGNLFSGVLVQMDGRYAC